MKQLTADEARRLLSFDAESGALYWNSRDASMFVDSPRRSAVAKAASWNALCAGKRAGSLRADGYMDIRIKTKNYKMHRVVWLIVHGEWPPDGLDHRDGDGLNNRPRNLRVATQAENLQNKRKSRSNTSGYIGAYFHKRKRRWFSSITVGYRQKFLGFADSAEHASRLYLAAKEQLHTFQPKPRETMEVSI